MDEKITDPPSYYPPQEQSNAGFEPALPYSVNQPYLPGQIPTSVVYQQPPPINNAVVTTIDDHMGMAIFATICCFWPLGIIAIMRASEVRSALAINDYSRAQRLSEESKRMSQFSIVIGAIIIVSIVVVVVIVNLSILS